MKKKVAVLLTVASLILSPIIIGPVAPNTPIVSLFTHGDG